MLCYVATCPECGQHVAAASTRPDKAQQTARDVAAWIRQCYAVDRLDVDHTSPESWHHNSNCAYRKGRRRLPNQALFHVG